MGSPADEPERESWQAGTESPQHAVAMPRAFAIGRFAVTVAEFAAFVGSTGHRTDGGCHVFDGRDWALQAAASWRAPGFQNAGDFPVVCVNWQDAQAYVAWLNGRGDAAKGRFRLPAEAEREYATRAGTETPFWWGRTIAPRDANYDTRDGYAGSEDRAAYRGATIAVQSFAPNAWGLHQVHGNVWEWTEDCYVDDYIGKPPELLKDGSMPRSDRGCDRRSLRGGAFNRQPKTLRAAYRTGLAADFRGHSIGFRVVRELPAR